MSISTPCGRCFTLRMILNHFVSVKPLWNLLHYVWMMLLDKGWLAEPCDRVALAWDSDVLWMRSDPNWSSACEVDCELTLNPLVRPQFRSDKWLIAYFTSTQPVQVNCVYNTSVATSLSVVSRLRLCPGTSNVNSNTPALITLLWLQTQYQTQYQQQDRHQKSAIRESNSYPSS